MLFAVAGAAATLRSVDESALAQSSVPAEQVLYAIPGCHTMAMYDDRDVSNEYPWHCAAKVTAEDSFLGFRVTCTSPLRKSSAAALADLPGTPPFMLVRNFTHRRGPRPATGAADADSAAVAAVEAAAAASAIVTNPDAALEAAVAEQSAFVALVATGAHVDGEWEFAPGLFGMDCGLEVSLLTHQLFVPTDNVTAAAEFAKNVSNLLGRPLRALAIAASAVELRVTGGGELRYVMDETRIPKSEAVWCYRMMACGDTKDKGVGEAIGGSDASPVEVFFPVLWRPPLAPKPIAHAHRRPNLCHRGFTRWLADRPQADAGLWGPDANTTVVGRNYHWRAMRPRATVSKSMSDADDEATFFKPIDVDILAAVGPVRALVKRAGSYAAATFNSRCAVDITDLAAWKESSDEAWNADVAAPPNVVQGFPAPPRRQWVVEWDTLVAWNTALGLRSTGTVRLHTETGPVKKAPLFAHDDIDETL